MWKRRIWILLIGFALIGLGTGIDCDGGDDCDFLCFDGD